MTQVRVMIVDDSPRIRAAVRELLRNVDGCNVIAEGANGLQALELARTLTPDIVVMDIHMPIMNGMEAACLIKSRLPSTRIVLMTTTVEPEVREQALRNGAIACLEKGPELWSGLAEIASLAPGIASGKPASD